MILGHFVVQLHLVFCILSTNIFLVYVQCLNVTAPDTASGLYGLKRMVRTNGMRIRDIIPLAHIHSPRPHHSTLWQSSQCSPQFQNQPGAVVRVLAK